MSIHTSISPEDAADRLAIRELIDAYGTCADRRLPQQQADLYIPGGRTLVFQGSSTEPEAVLDTREQHVEGFSSLSQYAVTTHFNGQFTVELDGDTATGKGNCLAHHMLDTDDGRSLILMSIRYDDQYAKRDGEWYFAERHLIMDWTDTRPSQP